MKILNTQAIYDADKITLERQGIDSAELMERAAVQIFNWMHARLQGAQIRIHIFSGVGNNGGDGLVLARYLREHGYNITVYVVNFSENRSRDFLINLDRLKGDGAWPNFMDEESEFPSIEKEEIIVDAIFGIGLHRDPDTWVADLISHLNRSRAFILAIDIPSGLFMDRGVRNPNGVVQASYVLSFQLPKLVFFLPGTGVFVDHWEVLDIGLDREFLRSAPSNYELVGKPEILALYRPREKFSHKGSYGHVLIIGGSYGKIGAVTLASKGSLYAGCGLVTAYVPKCGYVPLQAGFPEAMVVTDREELEIGEIEFQLTPDVIGIGVGMGTSPATVKAFENFLRSNESALVIDADGLNMLAQNPDFLILMPSKTVLTPHPKELERLIGKWEDDFDKLKKAREFSKKYDCILVIKGAHTLIVYGDMGYINTTGNPGMATGGSGDVLTGLICGLIAQGYEPLEAAIFGFFLHGRAADIAIAELGFQALTATGILNFLGKAYLDLFQEAGPEEHTRDE